MCTSAIIQLNHTDLSYTAIQDVVPKIPACAALFDNMTTYVVSERWTAKQSLRFLQDATETLDRETLNAQIKLTIPQCFHDYWKKLSPELRRKWAAYRTPPLPRLSFVMEWLFQFEFVYDIVAYVRRHVRG